MKYAIILMKAGGNMNYGENIKKIRKEKGLTQKQLGKKLGISQAAIGQFESNKTNPKMETLRRIANALEVDLWEIVELEQMDEDTRIQEIKKMVLQLTPEGLEEFNRLVTEALSSEKPFPNNYRKPNREDKENFDGQQDYTYNLYDHSYSFASSEEDFNKLQAKHQIELEKKNVSNTHKYDASVEITPEAMERLKEDAAAREILKKYESGEKILDSEYKKVIEYHNRMMERSKLLQDWLEWYKSTCEPLNNEGRKKVAEYAETLAETDKYTKPKEWFQGRMSKDDVEKQ